MAYKSKNLFAWPNEILRILFILRGKYPIYRYPSFNSGSTFSFDCQELFRKSERMQLWQQCQMNKRSLDWKRNSCCAHMLKRISNKRVKATLFNVTRGLVPFKFNSVYLVVCSVTVWSSVVRCVLVCRLLLIHHISVLTYNVLVFVADIVGNCCCFVSFFFFRIICGHFKWSYYVIV